MGSQNCENSGSMNSKEFSQFIGHNYGNGFTPAPQDNFALQLHEEASFNTAEVAYNETLSSRSLTGVQEHTLQNHFGGEVQRFDGQCPSAFHCSYGVRTSQ